MRVPTRELEAVVRRQHANPHSVLGAHPENGGVVVRAYRPAARQVRAKLNGGDGFELEEIHPAGVFEGVLEAAELPLQYELEVDYGDGGTYTIQDPYSFLPTMGELDLHLLGEGRHEELWQKLGAHVMRAPGRAGHGVRGLGAGRPGGERGRRLQLLGRPPARDALARLDAASGSCSCRTSGRARATSTSSWRPTGSCCLKADPLRAARPSRRRSTASVVTQPTHEWSDADWLELRRDTQPLARPMSIYEVHLGSWRLNRSRTTARSPTSSWPTSWPTTRRTWASRTWSCCR